MYSGRWHHYQVASCQEWVVQIFVALIRMPSSGKSSVEPVLGGTCGLVGRKSFLGNALLFCICGVLVSGHEVTVYGSWRVVWKSEKAMYA